MVDSLPVSQPITMNKETKLKDKFKIIRFSVHMVRSLPHDGLPDRIFEPSFYKPEMKEDLRRRENDSKSEGQSRNIPHNRPGRKMRIHP